ncbi:MAG TPA: MFS transporter [Anaerolineales bacterium]|nr:MFS transporter [Anaerolineales bacterium]
MGLRELLCWIKVKSFSPRISRMNTRTPTLILSFTLLVMMLGYGMVLPIMPFYIEHFGAGGRELGWMMSMYSLMQLICAPLWGILSDRIGRKPVLAFGVLGYAISLFLFGLATNFWMLFLARTLSGILSSATMPTAMAYIGDNAPEQERSEGMGQIGAATGIGIVLGPLLGGFLSTASLSLPFFIGAGLAFLAFLFVIAILPESRLLQPTTAQRATLTLGTFRQVFLSPAGVLLLLIFVMSFGLTSFQGITGLYVVDKFNFNTKQVGAIWMVMGGTLIVGQGALTGPLTKRFGEAVLIRAGLVGGVLGFIAMSLAINYSTILLALSFFSLTLALTGPALNAYISRFAGERQGTLMGLNSAATSLGRVIGPLWGGYLYEVNIEFPYLSGAAALVLALLVSWLGVHEQASQ